MTTLNNKTEQDKVSEFMVKVLQWDGKKKLSVPLPTNEDELKTYKLRLKLCIEETFELFEAMFNQEAYKPYQNILDEINTKIDSILLSDLDIDPVAVYDSLVDQAYVNYGFANLLGLDMSAGFEEVHKSNMTKLTEQGQPIFREDGKLLKSDQYIPPDLETVFKTKQYQFNK